MVLDKNLVTLKMTRDELLERAKRKHGVNVIVVSKENPMCLGNAQIDDESGELFYRTPSRFGIVRRTFKDTDEVYYVGKVK